MAARQVFWSLKPLRLLGARQMSGEWGSGAGKGGGTGGTVREAGGSFGKREAAQEEQYFRRLEQEQLKRLKDHLDEEVSHHEKEIKRHMEAIERHKKRMENLHEEPKDGSK